MIHFKGVGIYLLAILSGAMLGYIYWYFVGCSSGSCLITSNPVKSTIYGALMGIFTVYIFKQNKMK